MKNKQLREDSNNRQAKIIRFAPRAKPVPRDAKYLTAEIDTDKSVVVKAWLLEAVVRQHEKMADFLKYLQEDLVISP